MTQSDSSISYHKLTSSDGHTIYRIVSSRTAPEATSTKVTFTVPPREVGRPVRAPPLSRPSSAGSTAGAGSIFPLLPSVIPISTSTPKRPVGTPPSEEMKKSQFTQKPRRTHRNKLPVIGLPPSCRS